MKWFFLLPLCLLGCASGNPVMTIINTKGDKCVVYRNYYVDEVVMHEYTECHDSSGKLSKQENFWTANY